MKKFLILMVTLAVLSGVYYYFFYEEVVVVVEVAVEKVLSPLDATYIMGGRSVTLNDGVNGKISVHGEPSFGDINDNRFDDAVLILKQETDQEKVFYYVALAMNEYGEYTGTDTILLGDRINPLIFNIKNKRAVVSYLARSAGQSVKTPPLVHTVLHLQVEEETYQVIKIGTNYSATDKAEERTLVSNTWNWMSTVYDNLPDIVPHTLNVFMVNFNNDGTFVLNTDCNNISGTYEVRGQELSMIENTSTMMFCERSQEREFVDMLMGAESYDFTSEGELVIDVEYGLGVALFK